jgi:hypothetical protein
MDEIREDMTNFQGMFKNLNLLTEDIRFPDWAINVSECFKNCSGLRDIVSNWNTEYTQLENSKNCYQGTNIRTIDGEDDRVTSIPPEWGGLTFNDDDTLVIEIDTNLNTNKSLTVKFTVTGEGAILWGDNSDNDLDVANTSSTSSFTCTHTYAEHGIYTVKIKKTRLGSKEGTPVTKILSVPYSHKANHTKDYGILNSYAYNTYGEFYNVTEIDVSNLTKGTYSILIYTKTTDVENYDELQDRFRFVNSTMTINNKKYTVKYNKNKSNRIELTVE